MDIIIGIDGVDKDNAQEITALLAEVDKLVAKYDVARYRKVRI